ncbi:MAG: PKD domain-containing protein, partial [Oceanicaulis sp.]|nr:PKD domain-containing protein [Oceanicaulis sp.]
MKHLLHKGLAIVLVFLVGIGFLKAQISISGYPVVCVGDSQLFTIDPDSTLNYIWTTNGGGILNQNQSSATISFPNNGTFWVAASGYDAASNLIQTDTFMIQVSALPKPLITSNTNFACGDLEFPNEPRDPNDSTDCIKLCPFTEVTLYANGNPDNTYQWDLGIGAGWVNGFDSVVVNFPGPGNYSVRVREISNGGCISTNTICVEVEIGPQANFDIAPFSGAFPIETCVLKEIHFIDISTDNGGSPIVNWFWDFGDGNTSNLENPSHAYSLSGVFIVSLTVTNSCNCSSTLTTEVYVENGVFTPIICEAVACENGLSEYSVIYDDDCDGIFWDIDGGTIVNTSADQKKIIVNWDNVASDGFGYVKLYTPCTDCPDIPTILKVPVILAEGTIEGKVEICQEEEVRYALPQWPGTYYNWSVDGPANMLFNDQPNELLIRPFGSGPITIRCEYNNPLALCGGKARLQIEVKPLLEVFGDQELCIGQEGQFYAAGFPDLDWEAISDGGDVVTGNGSIFATSFPSSGLWNVIPITSDFCLPEPFFVRVNDKPLAPVAVDFPDSICIGTPYRLQAGPAISETTIQWGISGGTFTGGQTNASGNNVSATFFGAGPYEVFFFRQENASNGCSSDTVVVELYQSIINPDIARNNPDTVCANTFFSYFAQNQDGDYYEWSIVPELRGSVVGGNGGTHVDFLFNGVTGPTPATIVLNMRSCGIDHYDSLPIVIVNSPELSIAGPDSLCRGAIDTFRLVAVPSLASCANISWDMGDATYSGSPTVIHGYNQISDSIVSRRIEVTITDPNGCTQVLTVSKNVFIKPAPVAFVTPETITLPCDSAAFNDTLFATAQSGIGSTTTFQWYFNNILDTVNTTPVLPIDKYGEYRVVVSNGFGCSASSNIVYVRPFWCDSTQHQPGNCTPLDVSNISIAHTILPCGEMTTQIVGAPALSNINWNFGTNFVSSQTISGATGAVSYLAAGNYSIAATLFPSDTTICSATIRKNITIPMVGELRYDILCASSGYDVEFFDFSNYHPDFQPTGFELRINGATVATGTNPFSTMQNLAPGAYETRLIVTGPFPTCEVVDSLILPALPVADFNVNFPGACEGYPIAFENLSTTGTGFTYEWTFGDGADVSVFEPSRVYGSGGVKIVTLKVTNPIGCADSITKQVFVGTNALEGL